MLSVQYVANGVFTLADTDTVTNTITDKKGLQLICWCGIEPFFALCQIVYYVFCAICQYDWIFRRGTYILRASEVLLMSSKWTGSTGYK